MEKGLNVVRGGRVALVVVLTYGCCLKRLVSCGSGCRPLCSPCSLLDPLLPLLLEFLSARLCLLLLLFPGRLQATISLCSGPTQDTCITETHGLWGQGYPFIY
jgi:hypothetical protein